MKIYRDEKLSNFKFWAGAIANAEEFTLDGGDGYDETQINDLMRFEPEDLASLIGLEWDSETGKIIR